MDPPVRRIDQNNQPRWLLEDGKHDGSETAGDETLVDPIATPLPATSEQDTPAFGLPAFGLGRTRLPKQRLIQSASYYAQRAGRMREQKGEGDGMAEGEGEKEGRGSEKRKRKGGREGGRREGEREGRREGQTEALSTRIRQAGGGGAESSSPTRKATPVRDKALGRHIRAASRPNPESGDAPARETSVLDLVGEERGERPHRAGRRAQHPERRPATTVRPWADKPRVSSRHGRASAPRKLAGGQGAPVPYRPPGPSNRSGGRQSKSRWTTGRQAKG